MRSGGELEFVLLSLRIREINIFGAYRVGFVLIYRETKRFSLQFLEP